VKKYERFIWISLTVFLLFLGIFGFLVRKANASIDDAEQKLKRKLSTVLSIIERDYIDFEKIDENKLISGALDGLLKALNDPHTSYLSEEYWKQLSTTSAGTYGGVGMHISQKNDLIIVIAPMEGTPAYKKGIKAGDYILSVDGKSLKGISTDEAANMLRGPAGTIVKIEILSDDITYTLEITRANIILPTVKHSLINNKFGYLRITEFSGTTAEKVDKALKDFTDKNVEGIIVDLRYNPGGLLSSVIEISDYFLKEGVIVSTVGREENVVNKAKFFDTLVKDEVPLIVLIDSGSASASEIFAGAIKDNSRGILIGEKSYGKGSVQSIYQLDANEGFKLTIAKYYTPSGVSIEGVGITPDITVKDPELTDEEKLVLKKIYTDKVIDKILTGKKNLDDAKINGLVIELQNTGYKLNTRSLKKLVKNAAEIDREEKDIYDLEYDLQLKKAVEILDKKYLEFKDKKFILNSKAKGE